MRYPERKRKVATGKLDVRFICSADQLADGLTKPLSTSPFTHFRSKLPVCATQFSLRGREDNVANGDLTANSKETNI